MPPLSKALRQAGITGAPAKNRSSPLWAGPGGEGPQGGVTYSLLCRFLNCRERFRLRVVEGLKPADKFEPARDFGNLWHACEEGQSAGADWKAKLDKAGDDYCRKFPLQRELIGHWHAIAKALFPVYVEYWSSVLGERRQPLFQEEVFDVLYTLPSGRKVRLRAKEDAADIIGSGVDAAIYLQENKTKSQIDPQKIGRQVRYDLQTMMYLIVLDNTSVPLRDLNKPFTGYDPKTSKLTALQLKGLFKKAPIGGVRYNVVRRSAHKSIESMLKKVEDDRKAGRMSEWFSRWRIEVRPTDIERFRRESLDPILETLVQWWDWVTTGACDAEIMAKNSHWRHPFGVWNSLDEGGASELDNLMDTGSEVGLQRANDLFPELRKDA